MESHFAWEMERFCDENRFVLVDKAQFCPRWLCTQPGGTGLEWGRCFISVFTVAGGNWFSWVGRASWTKLCQFTSLPMFGFMAKLVEHCTGISQRSHVRILLKPWLFQASSFQLLKEAWKGFSLLWCLWNDWRLQRRVFNGVDKLYVSLQLYCWAIL